MNARRLEWKRRPQCGGIIVNLVALLFIVMLCTAVYFLRHPLFRLAAETWIIEDPLEHADALIVLSDDNFYADRATRAAELFRQGLAPLVVASGRRLRPSAGIAELMEHDLVERAVPREKIVRIAHDADNTREEAEALAQLAADRRWRSVIVVTSNYHTRRARYIFRHTLPAAMDVRVASARDGDFDPEHWWEKRKSIKELAREVTGMVVAIWELRGSNDARVTATRRCRFGRSGTTISSVAFSGTP
ncbi:MAG TPA: YdcF family protein [Candidatus Dormibacteraeota bacterium]|nr:YdcF family protein [Candidatus Dormibacteraeota bacterium]